jgi:hypothetical protein
MDIKDWIGRTETVEDVVTATPYAALSATLDRESARPERGTALPALWHWLYFLPLHRRSEIGPDGHAKRGGFLPPVPLPRRMWAGSQFQFGKPVRIGDAVQRTSTIESVSEKSGRTGALVFVKVRHEIRTNGERDVAPDARGGPRGRAARGEAATNARAAAADECYGRPDDISVRRSTRPAAQTLKHDYGRTRRRPPRHGRRPVPRRRTAPGVSATALALSDIGNWVEHYASDRSWPQSDLPPMGGFKLG